MKGWDSRGDGESRLDSMASSGAIFMRVRCVQKNYLLFTCNVAILTACKIICVQYGGTMKNFTVRFGEDQQKRLAEVAKRYKITQGEVLEVLIDNLDEEGFANLFNEKRTEKVSKRKSKASIKEELAKLNEEELRRLLELKNQQ